MSTPPDLPMFTPGRIKTVELTDLKDGPAKTWSPSTLMQFETCNYATFLKVVRGLKQPQSEAGDRGSKLHALCEQYIRGDLGTVGKDLGKVVGYLNEAREFYQNGKAIIEDEWGFDKNWMPTEWMAKDVWGRVKLDLLLRESPTSAIIRDWKSGKKFGNEVKHNFQGMIYAVVAFMRIPELEYIKTTFNYIDTGDVMENNYTRHQAVGILLPRIKARAMAMTTCTEFLPRPSKKNCKYCFTECEYRDE